MGTAAVQSSRLCILYLPRGMLPAGTPGIRCLGTSGFRVFFCFLRYNNTIVDAVLQEIQRGLHKEKSCDIINLQSIFYIYYKRDLPWKRKNVFFPAFSQAAI